MAVPDALTDRPQWVAWREQERSGKLTKVPVNPHTGGFASTTDPDSWGTFAEARAHATASTAEGIGFVFTDADPLVGVDLDDCRVPETGTLTEAAAAIVDRLNSYTEVSPSGTGVHVLVRGTLPEGRNRKGEVEMYASARFFTVTGSHVEGTPTAVAARSDALGAVHSEYVAAAAPEAPSTTAGTDADSDTATDGTAAANTEPAGEAATRTTAAQGDATAVLPDAELIERAKNAANGDKFTRLWQGDTTGYQSHSEADMALCALLAFWTGGDRDQLDRLFRESGLMRAKWDDRHYADGSTYGEKTIERVLASTDEFYDPPSRGDHEATADNSAATGTRPATGGTAQPAPDATQVALRDELAVVRAREQALLELVDDLRAEIERLEEANERLRAEMDAATTDEDTDVSQPLYRRLLRRLER